MLKHSFFVSIAFFIYSAQNAFAQVNQQDSLTLVELYNATNGSGWDNSSNWLEGPVDTWYGIGLVNDRVDTVLLSNNGLVGSIPTGIGMLSSLKILSLQNLGLSGPLPTTLGNLGELRRLFVSGVNISGNIPIQLGGLQNLETLSISNTDLSGVIPVEIGDLQNLEFFLFLDNRSLEGPVPGDIFGLPRLRLLAISNHENLTSLVPPTIGNAVELEQLILSNSGFEGAIPAETTNLNELEIINLENNNFSELPDFTAMNNLLFLTVQNNNLTFEDIEPNLGLIDQGKAFVYAPQKPVYDSVTILARAGSRLILKGQVGGRSNNYQWFKNGQTIEGDTSEDLILSNLSMADSGRYTAQVTSSIVPGLSLERHPVHLFVNDGGPIRFCTQAVLESSLTDTTAIYSWSTGETTPSIVVTDFGEYSVTVETTDYVLEETFIAEIDDPNILPGVDVNFEIAIDGESLTEGQDLLAGGPVQFINTSLTGTNFSWDFGDGTLTDQANPNHTFGSQGNYNVRLTASDDKGCTVTYQQEVIVQELFITNAITPNNDGDNDQFFVEPFLYPASLRVLNRWGQEVYFKGGYTNDFDGASLEPGVYFFELNIERAGKHKTGTITIMN